MKHCDIGALKFTDFVVKFSETPHKFTQNSEPNAINLVLVTASLQIRAKFIRANSRSRLKFTVQKSLKFRRKNGEIFEKSRRDGVCAGRPAYRRNVDATGASRARGLRLREI
ncbi:hypothetical protein CAMRE0001_0839 [Campylobacter rectus RM3267]|uniref:Uncharacterized protein n=1 Tax=Campylobacter rectus RM3267 TaxID=553218 RepID=B9D4X5_CAMRE|nr:hypothetical protein CAMRE0001_0839 [Campylobacter rectus RM3267]